MVNGNDRAAWLASGEAGIRCARPSLRKARAGVCWDSLRSSQPTQGEGWCVLLLATSKGSNLRDGVANPIALRWFRRLAPQHQSSTRMSLGSSRAWACVADLSFSIREQCRF